MNQYRTILTLAWPLIIANSFWNLQLTIDRVFLGMYSTEALGAAMAVMGVFWVPMALLQQTAGYVTAFVAQYFGANEREKISLSVWQSIHISWIGGILFVGLNFLSEPFFRMVGHGTTVQALEVEYFNSLAYTALPTAVVAAVSGYFTGVGRSQTVMSINFVGLILNVILDYVMIFGKFGCPSMGVAGAGYATALATYGAAAYGLWLIFYGKGGFSATERKNWHIDMPMLKQFLKFGLPSGAQWAFEGLAFTVFLIIMGRMPNGDVSLAGSSIAVTIMMLSVLPAMGVAQAVLTLVGQKMGEKNPDAAESITWSGVRICLVYMAMIASSFYLIPDFYVSWFKNEENQALWSAVSTLTPELLKIVAVFTVFDCMYLNISFALKGAGDTKMVSIIALTVPWPLMVLPTYLIRDLPDAPVYAWWFAALYSLSVSSILVMRFRKGKWKSMSLIQQPSAG